MMAPYSSSRIARLEYVAMLAMLLVGCGAAPTETSFGIDGSTFSCQNEECEIVFSVDNQMPHSMKIRYRAELSSIRQGVVLAFSDETEVPALERTMISRVVSVSERPDRLQVTVTTLKGL